jgi:hypothetical protein
MFNLFKKTFTDVSDADLELEKYIEESQNFQGKRATAANITYVNERQWKSNFILVNVIAEGYDLKRFLEVLVREKSKNNSQLIYIYRFHP